MDQEGFKKMVLVLGHLHLQGELLQIAEREWGYTETNAA